MVLKKIKFAFQIAFFPIGKFLGFNYDISKIINNYYRDKFKKLDKKDVAILLPHCVIHKKCPAKFSKEEGIMCISCGLCKCGEIRNLSMKKGYQFYITPSVGFTKRLIQRKKLKGVVGAACLYEVKKGLKQQKVGTKGLELKQVKVIPQLIYMPKYDCIENDLNWEQVKKIID